MSYPGGNDDIEDADPGLAAERTELAWTRTAISFAAVGAALLRRHPLAGIPVLALSLLIWQLGRLPGISVLDVVGAARMAHGWLVTAESSARAVASRAMTAIVPASRRGSRDRGSGSPRRSARWLACHSV